MSMFGNDPTVRRARKAGAFFAPERRRFILGGIISGAESLWNSATDAISGAGSDAASGALSSAADTAATAAGGGGGGGLWGALTNFFGPIGDFLGIGGGNNTGWTNGTTVDPMDMGGAAKDATWTQASDIQGASGLGMDKPAAMGSVASAAAPIAQGVNKTALALAALSTIGQMLSKPKQGTWQTPGPSSNSANLGPYWNQGLNTSMPGRTPVASPLPTSGGGAAPANYWAYGGPEQTYFTGNSLRNYGFAAGGPVCGALTHMAQGGNEFSTGMGNHVQGPGDGTSDSVPARLSDGEYVLTAQDVARLGNGSNDAGARRLDQFRERLAHETGQKQFVPAKAGGALSHLMAGAR